MSTIKPPLDPSKLRSGLWGEWWWSYGATGSGDFFNKAPSIDINGNSKIYNDSHGQWFDTNEGYSGWWWSDHTELTYEGTLYDGQSIVVIDADENLL